VYKSVYVKGFSTYQQFYTIISKKTWEFNRKPKIIHNKRKGGYFYPQKIKLLDIASLQGYNYLVKP
ncbi:MAG: hypothetical protein AB2421_01950, partial [Thermotaleaceae bacterium]